jgi:Glucose / Sorbosone dehydrogenase
MNLVHPMIRYMPMRVGIVMGVIAAVSLGSAPPAPVRLEVADYAVLPMTGQLDGAGQTAGLLARVTSLREEPDGRQRFFLIDLNGPLYILDKRTKALITYLDFNGREGRKGLFDKMSFEVGFANGLNSFQFDPDYARNGRFYTVHIEDPALFGSMIPDNTHYPGLETARYATTPPITTPGPVVREGVLIEWTDSNPANAIFEGSARELMRVQFNTRVHLLADLTFNPFARRGDADWGVMYIACGDGGSGESARPELRLNPQRLDTLVGKILRIIPDLTAHHATSSASENGRYRVPRDNPFVATAGARAEIWAYGFRNPHRLTWGLESGGRRVAPLIANSIGLHTWETINIVHRGGNYGYPAREGTEALGRENRTTPRPAKDEIPVHITDAITAGVVTPTYPVVQYGHTKSGGDAVGSGYVYRGKRLRGLRDQYVFTDISTGRVWHVDYHEMLQADDGDPATMATMHQIEIGWDDPRDVPDAGRRIYETLFPIVQAAYRWRGGLDPDLPGRATVSGSGRADALLAVDTAGELYVFSKSDGMIRSVVSQF